VRSPQIASALEQEIALQRKLSAPNVVRLISVQRSKRYIFLTLEYCAGGDLTQLLRRQGPLDEATCCRLIRDVAQALLYLHERNLVHRDIKPQNLLLSGPLSDPASVVKVADFGFARSLPPAAMASTLCGSPHYMSPELLAFKPYDAKADLWSGERAGGQRRPLFN